MSVSSMLVVFYRTICAMLNSGQGGVIYIGVANNRQVLGININRKEVCVCIIEFGPTMLLFSIRRGCRVNVVSLNVHSDSLRCSVLKLLVVVKLLLAIEVVL